MSKLIDLLDAANIPYETRVHFGGLALSYQPLGTDNRVCSVICHNGSYGHEDGLLEIMGLLTEEELKHDSVRGWLTADDVFSRIKQHYSTLYTI
jgi:hypothetical protein